MFGKSDPLDAFAVARALYAKTDLTETSSGYPVRLTNPLERFKREIGRRTNVVGNLPTTKPPSGSPPASSSNKTTNGSSATATSSKHSLEAILADQTENNNRKDTPELAAT